MSRNRTRGLNGAQSLPYVAGTYLGPLLSSELFSLPALGTVCSQVETHKPDIGPGIEVYY